MNNLERRTFRAELRKAGDAPKMSGLAIVFSQLSENLGGYREQIDPHALDGCDMADVRCLLNHEENLILGRTVSGTLELAVGEDGLSFACSPPDTTYARDLAVCMERGDIDQCSFSFFVAPGGAEWGTDPETGGDIRTVKKIARILDVSIVTYPAYPQTSSEIRSCADILSERPTTAGQQAPPASSGGADIDLLRRRLNLASIAVD